MMEKLPVCCARLQSRLTMEKANLARLAKLAAKKAQEGQSVARLTAKIADARVVIANAEQACADHEADHKAGRL